MSEGALWFLLTRSARNRIVATAARLRSPRYAAAVLVGIAYFVLVFAHPSHSGRDHRPMDPSGTPARLVALGLALLVAWWWVRGGFQRTLAFTPAEVDFLFPGPVRRRTLIALKMAHAQPGVLFTAALFLVAFSWVVQLPWPLAFLSLWIVLTTLQWHQLAASLIRANVTEHRTAAARRGAFPMAALAIALIALLAGVVPELPALTRATSVHDALAHGAIVLQRPGPRLVLFPFRLLLAPVLAPDAAAWAIALPGALALLALHFVWVRRMDAAFEETAAEAGRRRAELQANRKKGLMVQHLAVARPSRPWFDLAPTGPPATAIAWKNVLKFTREFQPRLILAVALPIIVISLVAISSAHAGTSGADFATGMVAAVLVMTVVMSPIGMRNDVRGDLRHMELLRTYPLSGRALVTAEIAGATASLSLIQVALLVPAVLFAALGTFGQAHPRLLAIAAVLAVPALVTVTTVQVTIQSTLALLFPAWVHHAVGAGIEGIGQSILSMIVAMLLFVLLLIPAAVVGGVVFFGVTVWGGTLAGAIAAGVAVGAALWGEMAMAVVWLGRVYDRLDPVEAGIVV